MKWICPKILLIVLLLIIPRKSSLADSLTSSLDSLRISIQVLQDSLQNLQTVKNLQLQEFKRINEQIYQLKKESENRTQPLQQFRLQNALKSSRKIADGIAELDRCSQQMKTQLQKHYQGMIKAIDVEVQKRMDQNTPLNRPNMQFIPKLGKEKLSYLNLLQSIQISKEEWQSLEIEPGDTPQRIEMKIAILNDKLNKLERSISQEEEKLEELKKDRKVHEEMLDFYIELSRSVEDEQEIFDRNRLDEAKDHLENLSIKIREMENRIIEMKVNEVNLKKKIEKFKVALK
jgi:hypothetical protein